MCKKSVLFVCSHNSARSQMAEGIVNDLFSYSYVAFSAGVEEGGVHPLAIRALAEMGIDISNQRSKTID